MLDAKVVVPLKYLSYFWRSLDLTLINSETELGQRRWSKEFTKSEMSITPKIPGNPYLHHLFEPWQQDTYIEQYFK